VAEKTKWSLKEEELSCEIRNLSSENKKIISINASQTKQVWYALYNTLCNTEVAKRGRNLWKRVKEILKIWEYSNFMRFIPFFNLFLIYTFSSRINILRKYWRRRKR